MHCSKCGSENPLSKNFCGDRGEPLRNSCPKSGADDPFEKPFDRECGAAPSADRLEAPKSPSTAPRVTAEQSDEASRQRAGEWRSFIIRRSYDSIAIYYDLDPEDWREMATTYQRARREALAGAGMAHQVGRETTQTA
jgi:hypothetical protein